MSLQCCQVSLGSLGIGSQSSRLRRYFVLTQHKPDPLIVIFIGNSWGSVTVLHTPWVVAGGSLGD